MARGADARPDPLVASYGPALLDRAIARCARAGDRPLLRRDDRAATARASRATDLTPDLAGFDLRRFLGGLRPAPTIDGAPHGRAGRSDHGGRPEAGRARQRRPARDAGGGRAPLRRPLLQAEGRRRCRGRSRPPARASPPCSTATPATTARRSTATSSTTSVEGIAELWRRMRETPALARLVDGDPLHRAADQAGQWRCRRPVAALGATEAARSSTSPTASWRPSRRRSRSATAASPARTARASTNRSSTPRASRSSTPRRARPRYFMSAEDLTTWAGVSVQQDLASVSLLGPHPCRAQRPPLHRRHVVRARDASRRPSPPRIPTSTSRAAVRRGCASTDGRLALGSLDCPGFAVAAPTWTSPPCARCRRRRAGRIGRAIPRRPHERASACPSGSRASPRSKTS